MELSATPESFRLAETFTISRGSRDAAAVLTVSTGLGRGECVPYARYGETMESVSDQVAAAAGALSVDADARDHMAAGAARNAVDCALWDHRAKVAGQRVWELLKKPAPGPVTTAYTLSLDTPENMEASARKHAARPLLKIKLGTPEDMPRLEAVRRGAPDARLIIDANEGWSVEAYKELVPHLQRLRVELVEQPLPAGQDDPLAEIERPVPICADESCHDRASLDGLKGKYDVVNIKLDKTGGLTEALEMRDAAEAMGFKIFVGCMVGTSLAMAPALLVAQGADWVDLDGPLLLAEDRASPLRFDADGLHPSETSLWG